MWFTGSSPAGMYASAFTLTNAKQCSHEDNQKPRPSPIICTKGSRIQFIMAMVDIFPTPLHDQKCKKQTSKSERKRVEEGGTKKYMRDLIFPSGKR